jgi:transposase
MSNTLPWPEQTTTRFDNRMSLQTRVEQRAAIVALSKGNFKPGVISIFTDTHPSTARRWICRVEEGKTLIDLPRCGRPRTFSEGARLMTIAVYCQQAPPLPGLHLWSLRDAERYFKEHTESIGRSISHATIQRILLEHALRPHRHKYYLQITDPNFFPKMEHIIGCYLNPPENLYCFDECTCIQALKRLTPNLPAGSNQPVLEDFEYQRNGVCDLLAFLNPATGTVYGRCTDNHNRQTLCEVFSSHIESHPPDAVIHYIMDNLTTHFHNDFCQTIAELSGVDYSPLASGDERRQWLQSDHKRIVVHFIPFHASWLNMVEIWFGILKSKCLKYDHFFSVQELRAAIIAFIDTWNEVFAHPFKWSYTGKDLHAKAVRRFCRLLSIQTDQMDSKFLASQLLLMSNIADNYIKSIPVPDWLQLLDLAAKADKYINNIIEMETGPERQKKARQAYTRFVETVIDNDHHLAKAA